MPRGRKPGFHHSEEAKEKMRHSHQKKVKEEVKSIENENPEPEENA